MGRSLVGGDPFWLAKNGIPVSFPLLETSLEVDVLILGGGISGALIAHAFAKAGVKVAVVDKRAIAHGSTVASTALLQYEIDVPLSKLKKQIGKEKAVRAYMLCKDAISKVETVTKAYGERCLFSYRPSVYFAGSEKDIPYLEEEYRARAEAGFVVSFLNAATLYDEYGIKAEGAIRSEEGGEVDPYMLTYTILGELQEQGHFIFENTKIDVDTIETKNGIVAKSTTGHTIKARKLIFATGYESQGYLKEKIVDLQSSFALVTDVVPHTDGHIWKDNALLWNTNDPYLYARTTKDNRILVGGRDIRTKHMIIRDLQIRHKAKKILKDFQMYMPHTDLHIAHAWSGTFGETKDGLAYIGESPEWPECYFALGFGGNGITYSALAGDLLVRLWQGETPDDLSLFRFGRNI